MRFALRMVGEAFSKIFVSAMPATPICAAQNSSAPLEQTGAEGVASLQNFTCRAVLSASVLFHL